MDAIRETNLSAFMLTVAELRLLPLLATHLTFPEIGERLFLSTNTIKTEAKSIYRKLNVASPQRRCGAGGRDRAPGAWIRLAPMSAPDGPLCARTLRRRRRARARRLLTPDGGQALPGPRSCPLRTAAENSGVVLLGLVGVGHRVIGKRVLESLVLAHVAGQHGGVPGPGVARASAIPQAVAYRRGSVAA